MPLILLPCLAISLAYLIGSVPTGFIIARFGGIKDIRLHGSGNIGATNVARVLGFRYFFIIFFLDFFKAFGFLLMLKQLGCSEILLLLSGLALLFGNSCSLFLGGRGGKGVATSCGIIAFINSYLFLLALSVWFLVFTLSRVVGIASIVTFILLPVLAWYINFGHWWFIIGISFWVLFLHRDNIKKYSKLMDHSERCSKD